MVDSQIWRDAEPVPHSRAMELEVIEGDITQQDVDAIVNAANSSLLGGGGVDGAIHRAAGPELLAACRQIGGCPAGEARMTPGYDLRARHVIHTVGPIWHGGTQGESEVLRSCYLASLRLAAEHNLVTIAFPSISTGVYGYPLASAAAVAVGAVQEFGKRETSVQLVRLVCFGSESFDVHRAAAEDT